MKPERSMLGWLAGAWCSCFALCAWVECERWLISVQSPAGGLAWFADWNPESTLPGLVLLLLPGLLWVFRTSVTTSAFRGAAAHSAAPAFLPPVYRSALLICVALAAVAASMSIGMRTIDYAGITGTRSVRFDSLPPAYHDEYSYQLQAATFRNWRWSWPPAPVQPALFHQFHVLNEPVTASRYFPLTGAWMALSGEVSPDCLGHWIAGAVAVLFFTVLMMNALPWRWAIPAGMLMALSPGMAVFGNLLLAHHPTLMALALFLWAFDRFMTARSLTALALSGVGLSAAMLGRPMTAAGFALPFGLWYVKRLILGGRSELTLRDAVSIAGAEGRSESRVAWRSVPVIAVPLIAGFLIIAVQNQRITGSVFYSPYQMYTDQFTPWHQYGFGNRDETVVPDPELPEAVRAYNQWAKPLTVELAAENVRQRVLASLQWTLGIVPLVFGMIVSLASLFRGPHRRLVRLLWASVVSLHIVHIPYWYDGILHWHYVFETAPLLIMLAVFGWYQATEALATLMRRRPAALWVAGLALSSLLAGWVDADWCWGPSKVSMAVSEQSWSRVRQAQFRELVHSDTVQHPALILVDETGADPQLSYIINPPDYQGDVLVCRLPQEDDALRELRLAFADRRFYVFEPGSFTIRELK